MFIDLCEKIIIRGYRIVEKKKKTKKMTNVCEIQVSPNRDVNVAL